VINFRGFAKVKLKETGRNTNQKRVAFGKKEQTRLQLPNKSRRKSKSQMIGADDRRPTCQEKGEAAAEHTYNDTGQIPEKKETDHTQLSNRQMQNSDVPKGVRKSLSEKKRKVAST